MDAINQISHHLDPWSQAPGRRRPKSCCSCSGNRIAFDSKPRGQVGLAGCRGVPLKMGKTWGKYGKIWESHRKIPELDGDFQ